MKNIEAGFLAKLIYTGDKKFLSEQRIKPELFTGMYRNVFNFVQEHLVEYGEIPTKEIVKRYFPTMEFPSRSKLKRTKLAWWAEELRRKATHNKIADAVEKIFETLENRDPYKAKAIMEGTLRDIAKVASITKDLDLTQASKLMREEYMRVEKTGGIVGLPTLFKSLDKCLGGLDKEQLITIIARTNQGKTWLLMIILYNIWKQGYTVCLGTKEMSAKQLATRFLSLHTGISHTRIRLGMLTPKEKVRYFTELRKLERKKNRFIIFYVEGGVTYLRTKIEEYKPDILGVDGMYLIDDDLGADAEWMRVANISRGLKALAQSCEIPIIGTSQANRATSKKTGPEVDNISYSDAVGQDSDIILGLNQTEEMRNDREIEVRVLKSRDSGRIRVMLTWDFVNMKFEEIYSDSDMPEEATPVENNKVRHVDFSTEGKKKKKLHGKPPMGAVRRAV